jgi:hypothetical protein
MIRPQCVRYAAHHHFVETAPSVCGIDHCEMAAISVNDVAVDSHAW